MSKKKREITDLTSIIVLNYNGNEILPRCVDYILNHTDCPYELIIVDNNSTDSSRLLIDKIEAPPKEQVPHLRRIKKLLLDHNYGYGIGNNKGMELATGKYICVLNNDIIVPKDWLSDMIKIMEDADADAVGPRCNYSGGYQLIKDNSETKPELNSIEDYFKYANKFTTSDDFQEVDVLMGWCLLFKREIYKDGGGFDERFKFGFWEDNDFSTRLIADGRKLVVASNVFLYHHGSYSFKKENIPIEGLMVRNQIEYVKKWAPGYYRINKDKLKVAIVLNWFERLTGSELYVLTLAKYLQRLDVDVTIMAPSIGGSLTDLIQRAGLKVSNLADFHKYDIIQLSHNGVMERTHDLVSSLEIPAVLLVHGLVPNEVPTANYLQYASHIVTVSGEVYAWLSANIGADPSKLSSIMNPIDPEVFNTHHNNFGRVDFLEKNLREDSLVIATSLRLDPDKFGVLNDLLNALPMIEHNVDLLICGDGQAHAVIPPIEKIKNICGNRHQIFLLGPVDNTNEVYQYADIVVGSGRTILEAAFMGIPAIIDSNFGYDGPLTNDTIAHLSMRNYSGRVNGHPFDVQVFLKDLNDVIDHPSKYMISDSLLNSKHNAEVVAAEFKKVYLNVLDKKNIGSATEEYIDLHENSNCSTIS